MWCSLFFIALYVYYLSCTLPVYCELNCELKLSYLTNKSDSDSEAEGLDIASLINPAVRWIVWVINLVSSTAGAETGKKNTHPQPHSQKLELFMRPKAWLFTFWTPTKRSHDWAAVTFSSRVHWKTDFPSTSGPQEGIPAVPQESNFYDLRLVSKAHGP